MNNIEERVLSEADYLIKTGNTIREISKIFGISKSTVHKDLHERLYHIDKNLFYEASKILEYHKDIRHIRGGEATRLKYLNL